MSQNSQARRAAKQRQARRAQGRTSTDGGRAQTPRSVPDDIARARAALAHARQQRRVGRPAALVADALLDVPPAAVDKAVELVLFDALTALFARGWAPTDLAEIAERRSDVDVCAYLLDAVAAVTAVAAEHLVDARWRAQLDQRNASAWWDLRRPQLSQWAARAGLSRRSALIIVVGVFGLLDMLPTIETTLPAPGVAVPRSPGAPARLVDPAQEKVLSKVRALLAKAESTEFDNEAEALSAKAQQLMSRYALDQALLEHDSGVRPQATLCRIWLDAPYVSAKSSLVAAVARANRCRAVLAGQLGYVCVLGSDLDLRLVELLATSLLVQGSRAMLAAGSQTTLAGVSRTRSFRHSFLLAYAGRIGERLRAADESTAAATAEPSLLPVLSARSLAVEELMRQQYPRLVTKSVSISNADGWGAGRLAADRARLDLHQTLNAAG